MTNVSAVSIPVYIPPQVNTVAAATPAVPQTAEVTDNITINTPAPVTTASSAPATNANDSSSGIYTALANVSAPTIRGTNLNTAS